MHWVWTLYEQYVGKLLGRRGIEQPGDSDAEAVFLEVLRDSTVTVLVQEPWRGSVRFKCLSRYDASDMFELLNNPSDFLLAHFGGGKFKLNFHHGWNFVATRNFKPVGDPKWKDLPALESELSS